MSQRFLVYWVKILVFHGLISGKELWSFQLRVLMGIMSVHIFGHGHSLSLEFGFGSNDSDANDQEIDSYFVCNLMQVKCGAEEPGGIEGF